MKASTRTLRKRKTCPLCKMEVPFGRKFQHFKTQHPEIAISQVRHRFPSGIVTMIKCERCGILYHQFEQLIKHPCYRHHNKRSPVVVNIADTKAVSIATVIADLVEALRASRAECHELRKQLGQDDPTLDSLIASAKAELAPKATLSSTQ